MKESLLRETLAIDKAAQKSFAGDYEARARWLAIGSGHRFMAYKTKLLVLFTGLHHNKPQVVTQLKCLEVDADIEKGMGSTWLNTQTGQKIHLDSRPTEVMPGVFVGHTFYSGVEYLEHRPDNFGLRFSMYYRSAHNPNNRLVPGANYIQEKAAFDEKYGSK